MPARATKTEVIDSTLSHAAELSRQLLKAQEEERSRISRELHDETGQALMVLRFHLEMLAGDASSEAQRSEIQEALEVLDRSIEGLRRIIARLSPRILEELGLVAAIRRQAELLVRQTSIKPHLDLPGDFQSLDHDIEVVLYRSAQEALHNLAKHAHARNFTVRLAPAGNKVSLEIEDDGIGFSTRNTRERGFGLNGMRERAAALGGSVKVHSEKGKGTHIRILLPWITDGTEKREQTAVRGLRHAS